MADRYVSRVSRRSLLGMAGAGVAGALFKRAGPVGAGRGPLRAAARPAIAAAGVKSVARQWDEAILDAIRIDSPRPPVHARNLYHFAAAMWDAWAAYDRRALQVFHRERASAADVAAARNEAVSYAAYRIIRHRYTRAFDPATTLAALDARFAAMGFDAANTTTQGTSPAALGNRVFETIRDRCMVDGANEEGGYRANNGYKPVNAPLAFDMPGAQMVDPNRWQPLQFREFVEQNGIPRGVTVQTFVCPHWDAVTPFALTRAAPRQLYLDTGPPPLLGGATDAAAKAEFVQIIRYSSQLDPDDGATFDSSPGAYRNNPLGTNDGAGYANNPVTGRPYAPNVVRRADYARIIAEFWADGPASETPPGHWNVIANEVSDHPLTVKRIGGTGGVVDDLEWDVKLYLAINGAVHDAAIVSWGLKGKYDSVRPISAIRYAGVHGQNSDPNLPSHQSAGLPLIPELIELITSESSAPGKRHEHLAGHIDEIAIRSWRGEPANPGTQHGGAGWILASTWVPYQKTTFVTPAFAGYTSGHSTFSRSAAEVMTGFTGSEYFPGGLKTFRFPRGVSLKFEAGPSQDIELQWATYYDAADEAGISRLYGGIHIPADDFGGRIFGSRIGRGALAKASAYFTGAGAIIPGVSRD